MLRRVALKSPPRLVMGASSTTHLVLPGSSSSASSTSSASSASSVNSTLHQQNHHQPQFLLLSQNSHHQIRSIHVPQEVTDPVELRRKVLTLYRDILKSLPWMKKIYFIHMPLNDMTRCMEKEFRKFQHIKDIAIIDQLILRAEIEFEEALYHFKQRGHFYRWFKTDIEVVRKPKYANPELEEFFAADRTFPLDITTPRPLEKPKQLQPAALENNSMEMAMAVARKSA